MLGSRKNSKRGNCSKIRTVPTTPLHAMLDELLVYRDYVLIIVLKHNEVMGSEVKKGWEVFFQRSGTQVRSDKKERKH